MEQLEHHEAGTSVAAAEAASQPLEHIKCEAFHPMYRKDCPTVLTFTLPPVPEEDPALVEERMKALRMTKQHNYHICLDVSGSMSGAMSMAKESIRNLIDHLLGVCQAKQDEIIFYIYSDSCQEMALKAGGPYDWENGDKTWFWCINARGGTNFASVFSALVKNISEQKNDASTISKDMVSTIFFFTDGRDGYSPYILKEEREKLEQLIKHSPGISSTVHSFGYTSGHDAGLLGWLTQCGTEQGCFQFIESTEGIENAMTTTLNLLTHVAHVPKRELEFCFKGDDTWIQVKTDGGHIGSYVLRDRSLKKNVEPSASDDSQESVVGDGTIILVREIQTKAIRTEAGAEEQKERLETVEVSLEWVEEDSQARITGFASFVQHELLQLVERVNKVLNGKTREEQQRELRKIDEETEALARSLGAITATAARMKKNKKEKRADRNVCMELCSRTKSLLQSFLALKAEAHKGTVSNLSLANFNSLAYGQITQARLKAKLDARAGKNIKVFQKLDDEIEQIVEGLDLKAMEAAETEERLRELSCAFSTQTYIEALEDHDCICLTFDVARSPGAIADSSQLTIKSIGPTYITSSMYTEALQFSLGTTDFPEEVHGGFDRANDANVVGGLAREKITAVMPLYINKNHWKVARLRMKPILGYVVTLDPTGYTYSQMTTVPFLLLMKALEANPMSDFRQRQFKLILETCDAIYRGSNTLRESLKAMVEKFCELHVHRTADVIQNIFVFLGHVICARRAGDISADDVQRLLERGRLEAVVVEEQIRRDMSWRVDETLMGSVFEWFDVDQERDIREPEARYRKAYAAYIAKQEEDRMKENQEADKYRNIFRAAQRALGLATEIVENEVRELDLSDAAAATGQEASLEPPVFEKRTMDIATFTLSERSETRLQQILNAVSYNVDKVMRLLAVLQSPEDTDLDMVLSLHLAPIAPPDLAAVFFSRFSRKTLLATVLQAFAHVKNASRRTVQNLMAPFDDAAALEYLDSLYKAKMDSVASEIVSKVIQSYTNNQQEHLRMMFQATPDLEVAAGILLCCKARGGDAGPLATASVQAEMVCARPKILMLLNGKFRDVVLFSDQYLISANLANVWQDAVSPQSKVRMIKISIINESLEEDGIFNRNGSFDEDFKLVNDNMKENEPAYFVYRMDSKNAFASREWVFLCFVPDIASVRQKMIYAATRATLTKELGDSHFTDNLYGTNMSDFTLEGYKRHRASLSAPKPLTERERQLAEIRENEKLLVESMKGASQRKAHAPGMNFPLTDEAIEALKKLAISKVEPAPATPATIIVKKKVVRRVTVPKKKQANISSPASTPLPESPVVSRTNTSATEDKKEGDDDVNVKDDEWDDDEEKAEAKSPVNEKDEEKKQTAPAESEEKKEEEEEEETEEIEVEEEVEEEVPAPVPEPPKKVERTINFVKLAIDPQNERIELVGESKIDAKELTKNIDEDAPRFTFFAYEHTHQGKEHDSLVFMYTCPSKSKIRERMLYSSCRAGVLEAAKSEAGLEVDKKLETTDVSELTEGYVREELHARYETASPSLRSSNNSSPRVGGMSFGGVPLPAATSGLGNGSRGFSKPVRPGARKVM
ncbi:hypothetical protein BGW41_006117 [Actinomortierella wolfii]|nr:hypothetical protein BGW41_006117 [Actinomortierella wolfii]